MRARLLVFALLAGCATTKTPTEPATPTEHPAIGVVQEWSAAGKAEDWERAFGHVAGPWAKPMVSFSRVSGGMRRAMVRLKRSLVGRFGKNDADAAMPGAPPDLLPADAFAGVAGSSPRGSLEFEVVETEDPDRVRVRYLGTEVDYAELIREAGRWKIVPRMEAGRLPTMVRALGETPEEFQTTMDGFQEMADSVGALATRVEDGAFDSLPEFQVAFAQQMLRFTPLMRRIFEAMRAAEGN